MKKLNQKLEIEKINNCKWLAKQGLLFDKYLNIRDNSLNTLDDITEDDEDFIPWFSLERVLELLPKKIEIKDHMIIEPDIPECLGVFEDVVFYFTLDGDGVRYQRYCQYEGGIEESIFREEGDYHLAALKLLKKVIETYGMEIVNESRTN